jgi:4-aminobutyrate aminotransferase-like enzyme
MESLAARRTRLMGPNVPTFYRRPLEIVRGEGVWLWDAAGHRYLDAYNNVPHVGHCHPRVVDAVARQLATLDTHSRYLHAGILDYAERLTATFGDGLTQALFACTGSEAMDVALRMAQAATGRTGIVATDNTYHGNTNAVAQLSARRPPLGGYPPHVRLVPSPDARAPLGGSMAAQPAAFAAAVARAAEDLAEAGHGLAALVVCPVFANEGLPGVGRGWLDAAAAAVREVGGVLIVDEVQPGLGRVGTHMWGHGLLRVAPDIVVLGKALGNGHPLAALVTRPDHMAAFRDRFGYFNTTAATPVAAAAGTAVLDVMADEGLCENAGRTGARLTEALGTLSDAGIARVTTHGLMAAVEVVDGTGHPDAARAEAVVERMKDAGVLIGRIGRQMHVLKIRPPMPFATAHVDRLVEALHAALAAAPLTEGAPA